MPRPTVRHRPFGTTPEGEDVALWRLDSPSGVYAEILTYGGVLHALGVPDTTGRTGNVVLSLPSLDRYAEKGPYLGALIGRYANRVAHGRFTLGGAVHEIPVNDRGHALHGGPGGFDGRVWEAEPFTDGDTAGLRLRLHSPDGDMGFPGALDVTAVYALDAAGTLALDCAATTDRTTVVNLSHHAYFNLAADGGHVLDHTLGVDGAGYLPVDPDGIPLGPVADVAGTPFDLTSPRRLGDGVLAGGDEQVRRAGGYDHCWALSGGEAGETAAPRRAARLAAPGGTRAMEVWTTAPGLQVYTANQLDGTLTDPGGRPLSRHGAVCLEPQHFPDAPNRPAYPSAVLEPGTTGRRRTEFRFPGAAR
ncbi:MULTISPECIES: aldose epimerase family protein [unclassified Streptomyces]|uniref:aldose epimerase family protein n=1 Tax=unclassified Streptomyces TaxID=2593676 RepID=UPI0006B04C93|nr:MULTISPECIES: aldose epimerase family protein [unclassified Streptomyces]KOX25495.1 aldose epimerase [Streptomyces sp. NRRL F-6491]KOX42122.1 aldose epimerase [Streptomyces sp. NRRL F-6492]